MIKTSYRYGRFKRFLLGAVFLSAVIGASVYCLKSGLFRSTHSSDWMDRAICRDFKRFEKNGITRELLDETWKSCKSHQEFQRYKIIDSKVYGPDGKIKNLLDELVCHYPVPDVDFIYYYEDRIKKSFFRRKAHVHSGPIFVSAKDKTLDYAILFSDWVYDIKDDQHGWNFLIKQINENRNAWDWTQKIEKLFWRGMPWDGKHFGMYRFENWTSFPRGRLVFDSMKNPDLIDAAFSQYPDVCRQQDPQRCVKEMGPIKYVPWSEVLHYKYQMIIDGVTCSFPAAQWKLLSGSLSFMQESNDIQFFYNELSPWKHYVPVKSDLSDLSEKILWAKTHDEEAKLIADNAREFALTHIMPEHILLYCYKVLIKYASLQKFQPSIKETLENPIP